MTPSGPLATQSKFDLLRFFFVNLMDEPLVKVHLLLQHAVPLCLSEVVHTGKKEMLILFFNVLWIKAGNLFQAGKNFSKRLLFAPTNSPFAWSSWLTFTLPHL